MTAKVDRITAMLKNMIDFQGNDFEANLDNIAESVEESLKEVWRDNTSLPCDCFYQLTIVEGKTDGEYLSCCEEKCDNCGDCCGECGKNGHESDSDDDSSVSSAEEETCDCGCEEEKDEDGHSNRCDTTQFCVQCCDCAYCVGDRCEKCYKVLEAMKYGCGVFEFCKECCDCGDCREETGRCPACGVKGDCVGENCDCVQCGECEKYLTYQEFNLREDWIFDVIGGVNLCGECK